MEKFKEALKHSDIVKVVLTGVGETCFLSEEVSEYIEELERLARIGRATEKALEEKGIISLPDKTPMSQTRGVIGGIDLEDIEQLLIWAESEGEMEERC